MAISSVWGHDRENFSRHSFRGGNFFMMSMLNRYHDELGVKTLPQEMDMATNRTIDHLKMQAALQQYVDNSISKTINIPEGFPFSSFKKIYENAYHNGLKGCTTFRPNPTTGSVLKTEQEKSEVHCCTFERESD